jgi:iron(III) transport system ATP-binding protein
MTAIRCEHVSKTFERAVALDDVSVEIASGELFFLLGPSGCGKTTLLRLIAGLLAPTSGRIFFDDRDVTELGTERRNAVMCFQGYALWPHMSVRANVRFGLEARGQGREEQRRRVDEVLALVQMEALADRKPNELSGGQQQRVALARALAVSPACLLLDEPLSNLDAKLRHDMRAEIKRICKAAGITTIYVTHDQAEALSIADRIAVLREGRLLQVGTPGDLYRRPRTTFLADFIGQANLLRGTVVARRAGTVDVETPVGRLTARAEGDLPSRVTLAIRPEQMKVTVAASDGAGRNRIAGTHVETTFLGGLSEHVVLVNGQRLKIISAPPLFDLPAELVVEFDPEDVVVLTE